MLLVAVLVASTLWPGAARAAGADSPPGLVAWWGGDGNAGDMFGTWDGTLVGDTSFVAGQVGEAFSFDGSGDRVDVLDPAAGVLGADPFTVAFWVRADADHVADYLVGKSYPNGGTGWDLRLGDRRLYLVGLNGWPSQWNLRTDQVITIGQWHHVAVTSDGATSTLYLDGATDPAWTIPRQPVSDTSNPLRFGFTTDYGGTQLDGALDEIQLYDRALSQAEVQTLSAAVPDGACRPCAPLPRDAFGWWRAEDSAADEIGSADGTLWGNVTYAHGLVGRAFAVDGEGDFVELPDSPAWDFGTGSFSVSAWVRAAAAASSFHNIVRHDDGSGGQGYWGLRLTPAGQLEWFIGGGGGQISLVSAGSLDDGNWYAVTAVRDAAAGELRLYVDGLQAAAPVSDGAVDVTGPVGFRMGIGAGLWAGGGSFEHFEGEIDEVMMVDRALTAAEARRLANACSSGVCTSCAAISSDRISRWKGDGTADDDIGSNHGTLVNGASYAPGLVGQAFQLVLGVYTQHVEIPHHPSLSFATDQPMSIDLWVNRTNWGGNRYLLAKLPNCDPDHWNYQVWNGFTSQELWFSSSSGLVGSDALLLPADTWTHVAITFDGGDATIWVDGQPAARGAFAFGPDDAAPPLLLGAVGTCHTAQLGFLGLLDEVQIHGRALHRDEVYALHAAGAHGACGPPDTTPDPFAFTDQTGAPLSTVVTSDAITVLGIEAPADVEITACTGPPCEYAVNAGAWTATAGTVAEGDTVEVRQTTAATYATTTDLTLDVGAVSDTFSVTTLSQYTLTVSVSGSGDVASDPAGIDCPAAQCAAPFDEAQTVTLTPAADPGWWFAGFSGNPDCADGEVTMTGDVTCTARFEYLPIFADGFESGDTTGWSDAVP